MIAFVEGKLEYAEENACVINANGVGYRVNTPLSDIGDVEPGENLRLYTYLNVREDAMLLYGFRTQERLKVFCQLINVSGVGPKFALNILSAFTAEELVSAIASENVKALSSVSGIGKKTAERIVLELKDKIHLSGAAIGTLPVAAAKVQTLPEEAQKALGVLLSLGYGQSESQNAVVKVFKEGMTADEIIEECMTNVF